MHAGQNPNILLATFDINRLPLPGLSHPDGLFLYLKQWQSYCRLLLGWGRVCFTRRWGRAAPRIDIILQHVYGNVRRQGLPVPRACEAFTELIGTLLFCTMPRIWEAGCALVSLCFANFWETIYLSWSTQQRCHTYMFECCLFGPGLTNFLGRDAYMCCSEK